jgi:hypothetical protein
VPFTSAYHRHQRHPTTRTFSPRPHPEATATPNKGTPPPGAQDSHTSQPKPRPSNMVSVASKDTASGNVQPIEGYTARPSETLVPHVAGKTIPHRCVGSPLSMRVRCTNNLTPFPKEHSITRPGTYNPNYGARGDPHHNPISTSGYPRMPRTSDAMDTHSTRRPKTSTPQPWRTPAARAASPAPPSCLASTCQQTTPVNLIMHSASGTNLPIKGAELLRMKAQPTGIDTRQMVYFSLIANGPGSDP